MKIKHRQNQRGAALLTVLVALMILTILLLEFQYASMVERKLAYNDLNQTQAQYLAKSAVRIGLLRLALYARLKNNPQISAQMGAAGPMLDMLWQMPLPPFPPDSSQLGKMMVKDRQAAERVLEQTKIEEGQYSVSIKSETAKINLNSLVVPADMQGQRPNFRIAPTGTHMQTGVLLVNLINRFLQESEDPLEEYPDLNPEELVMDIMDWVTPGDGRLAGGSKDAYYQQQDPPYRAKRNRFFTTEELRMVRGVTGKIYEKLEPHVTVFAYDNKINLNDASDTLYRAIYPDFTDDDLRRLQEYRAQIGVWPSERSFRDFIVQNLNRPAFDVLYPKPQDYPFTVGSESFLIEGLGVIRKSASSVQRAIRAVAAFTSGGGGQIVPLTQQQCVPPDYTWNPQAGRCISNPTNAAECGLVGQWISQGGREGCSIRQTAPNQPMFIPAPRAGKKRAGGNALKLLHWYEI